MDDYKPTDSRHADTYPSDRRDGLAREGESVMRNWGVPQSRIDEFYAPYGA